MKEDFRRLRHELGFTQASASAMLDITRFTYWRYEHGKNESEKKLRDFQTMMSRYTTLEAIPEIVFERDGLTGWKVTIGDVIFWASHDDVHSYDLFRGMVMRNAFILLPALKQAQWEEYRYRRTRN